MLFEAAEIGLEAFGHNIENRHLIAALDARAAALTQLARIGATVTAVEPGDAGVTIRLDDGATSPARLVVGADGRKSLCRAAAGIATERTDYPQAALTLNLTHTRPHNGISTEFHTESGPFTLVPLPGLRSSLVCVTDPDEAEHLAALEAAALSDEIERRAHSILGKITVEAGRGLFPLGIETARTFAARRIALVGRGRACHPADRRAGAQSRPARRRDHRRACRRGAPRGRAISARTMCSRATSGMRRADVTGRALLRSTRSTAACSSDFLPVQGMRGLGLYLLDRIAPLRRALMREGVEPPRSRG